MSWLHSLATVTSTLEKQNNEDTYTWVLLSSKMAGKLTTCGWTMIRKYLTIAWNLRIPQVSSFFLRGPVFVTFLLYKPHRPHRHCCWFDLYLVSCPIFLIGHLDWWFPVSYHSRQFFNSLLTGPMVFDNFAWSPPPKLLNSWPGVQAVKRIKYDHIVKIY